MLHILLLFSFLLSSSLAAAKDLCVADFKATQGPAGYQCKVPEEVVVDDFVYSGLNVAGNFSDIVKSAFNTAIVDLLPGLNGLGLPWHDWTYPVVNSGPVPALLWSSFSTSNPGLQVLSNALFSNNLPSELIEKVTFLDELEVKRLKALFGGSGLSSY
ncbi:Auxin-binding protein ABP19a [Vitis vinifera]|uniref:Auxin-binding protein ABP19a n=1 Tax=Vitis vinifera TaxID=29760 RepID=A0A438K712_VITVI|nr:Auxin-binding protein ABP19a [Vitis vinifera]